MADRDAPDAGLLIDGARVPAAAGERAPVRGGSLGIASMLIPISSSSSIACTEPSRTDVFGHG